MYLYIFFFTSFTLLKFNFLRVHRILRVLGNLKVVRFRAGFSSEGEGLFIKGNKLLDEFSRESGEAK